MNCIEMSPLFLLRFDKSEMCSDFLLIKLFSIANGLENEQCSSVPCFCTALDISLVFV